ncbi:hypothetical protein G6R29_04510 [Fructobacillus sp. M2-14]|uniref:Uncharacterized protein n=1 Tax=Fructobacillus broussonetiae TaxID=2713173 RepID=A0ABS5R0C1_9LACO|nr:hypothetical protein [Fructobacillus broussonetiae]MBS9338886.1 hypothetical protein [Fructobacillus broussonetiae]
MREKLAKLMNQYPRTYMVICVAIATFTWSIVRLIFVKNASLLVEVEHFVFLTAFVAIANGIVWFIKKQRAK